MHSAFSLPGVAHGGQQTKRHQTSPKTIGNKSRQQTAVESWGRPSRKIGAKTIYFWSFFDDFETLWRISSEKTCY